MRRRSLVSPWMPVLLVSAGVAGGAARAANQPPTARFTVTPGSGTVERVFQVDASASTDDRTPASRLKVRWDWENDGVWDTAYTTVKTATHQYAGEGNRTIRLEVLDNNSATGTTTQTVAVGPPAIAQIVVGGDAREPDVDVNPTDAGNVVVSVASTSSGGLNIPDPAYASVDGGSTWTRSLGQDSNREGDPAIEFLPGGTAVLMSLDDTGCDGNPQGLQIDLSTDKGLHFTRAGYAFDQSTLFLLPNGSSRAVCGRRATYPCTSGNWDDLFFDYPKIAADKGAASPYRGNLYAIAHSVPFDQDGDGICDSYFLAYARSVNGGATWTSAQVLPTARLTSALGIGANGVVYYANITGEASCLSANGIRLRRSTDGGVTFGLSSCAYEATGDLTPSGTWTAADPVNPLRVYVVFNAGVASLGGSVHAYVIRSLDGGATWSTPVRIDDVLPGDAVDHFRPSLSVSTNGRLDVIWFDYRFSSPTRAQTNGQVADVYYAYSEDAGATWSRNLRLTTSPAPALYGAYNDFLTITSSGSRAYAAYSLSPDAPTSYEAFLTTIVFN